MNMIEFQQNSNNRCLECLNVHHKYIVNFRYNINRNKHKKFTSFRDNVRARVIVLWSMDQVQ